MRKCRLVTARLDQVRVLRRVVPIHSDRLVCRRCRHIAHHETHIWKRYNCYRDVIGLNKVAVCHTCDEEQRDEHGDAGYDGCTCYRDLYERQWLCHDCADDFLFCIANRGGLLSTGVRSLQIVANRMRLTRQPLVPNSERPLCPCGRSEKLMFDPNWKNPMLPANAHDIPFLGHHLLALRDINHMARKPRTLRHTKQCLFCLGYVVPPRRTSARIARLPRVSYAPQRRRQF